MTPAAGAALLAAGGLAALHMAPALAAPCPRVRAILGVEDRIPPAAEAAVGPAEGPVCALTFDDGPHPRGTPAVLEALAEAGATATFFLAGEQAAREPRLVRETLAAGHSLGLHCQRHRNLLRLTPGQTRTDIDRARAAIEDAAGVSPLLYRPPYGILNATALALARARGWRTLLWSHWGRDWRAGATPESIAAEVTAGVRAGSVLLLHDADHYSARNSWRATARALPLVLEALAARGLRSAAL